MDKAEKSGVNGSSNLSKAVEVENLTVIRGKKSIYKDFYITFQAGTVNALLAPSGAGKTTLLDCIASLLEPSAGTIKVGGKSIKEFKQAQ